MVARKRHRPAARTTGSRKIRGRVLVYRWASATDAAALQMFCGVVRVTSPALNDRVTTLCRVALSMSPARLG